MSNVYKLWNDSESTNLKNVPPSLRQRVYRRPSILQVIVRRDYHGLGAQRFHWPRSHKKRFQGLQFRRAVEQDVGMGC
jgi:hypothetical protein